MQLKTSSAKWRPFCPEIDELIVVIQFTYSSCKVSDQGKIVRLLAIVNKNETMNNYVIGVIP